MSQQPIRVPPRLTRYLNQKHEQWSCVGDWDNYVDTLDEGDIIDIVIDHMNDTLTESKRFKVYDVLDRTRSRDHGNWYWIIRRIRNTGSLSRLEE
jgi:hypothetical protein